MSPAPTPDGATQPSEHGLRRARVFWEQSQADLKAAKARLRARAWLESSYQSFQAAINALTCVCYLHGEYRVPNFSTVQLVAMLRGFDPAFEALEAPALALEAAQALNPYAAQRDAEQERAEARLYYDHAATILKAIRGYLKTHKRRYFTP